VGFFMQLLSPEHLARLSPAQRDILRCLTPAEMRPLEAVVLRTITTAKALVPLNHKERS
jgi:hypothetical protein